MACECNERLNTKNNRLDNNIQLDNKMLNIDSMASMSIDDIVKMYRKGYRLEEKSIENKDYVSLTYATECSGAPVIDKSDATEFHYVGCYMNSAFAQKFVPASQCLSSVTIKVLRQATYGSGVSIHIVPDVDGLPPNNWLGGSIGSATKPSSQIPTTATEVNFPLNLKLNNLNPLWIVVTADIYDSASTDYLSEYIRISNSITGSGGMAGYFSGTWTSYPTWNMVYKTYKMTYASAPVVLTTIDPIEVITWQNAYEQFLAKDQNSNTITTGVVWAVQTGVGSIDATTGLYFTGHTNGIATIAATYLGVTKTASVTVSTTPPATGGGAGVLIGIVGVAALGIMMTSKKS